MARRWVRGPTPNLGSPGDSFNDYARVSQEFNHFIYYFFRRMLGWNHVDEGLSAGKSFENGHSATGTDGVLTASDFSFSAASASFVVGDVGKFLVLVDATNEVNCGIYEITAHTSGTAVVIDFNTPPTDFPTAATGITWYLLDPTTYAETVGDFWVLDVPHATSPYQLRGEVVGNAGQNFNGGTVFQLSVEANAWDAAGDAWKTTHDRFTVKTGKACRGDLNQAHGRFFAYGDTDGSHWMVWSHNNNALGNKQGCGASILSPLEASPVHTAKELILLWGNASGAGNNANWDRRISFFDSMADAYAFSEERGIDIATWWAGYAPFTEWFRRTQQVNHRTGDRDALPIWCFRDPDGTRNLWAPWGELPTAHIVLATVIALGEHVPFDSDNYFHIRDGVTIPWPGVGFQ